MTIITLAPSFGYVILDAVAMGFQCLLIGGMIGGLRRKFKLDYPDMGNGRYAAKLTDEQWLRFNNYQRAHYNYVEQLPTAISLLLLGGLYYPTFNAYAGAAYVVGRQLYAWGYQSNGAKGRYIGVLVLDLALISMLVTSVLSGLHLSGLVKEF